MEDDLIFFLKMKDDLKKQIMQPKTNKSKNNVCGTAPGNLVVFTYPVYLFTCLLQLRSICKKSNILVKG